MATKVLAFMCQPGHAEFVCAGTLIRLRQEAGCEIAIATATSGEGGPPGCRPDEIARIHNEEARASARILGAELDHAGCTNLLVMYDEPTLRRFIGIVRKLRPDIVIAPAPVDYRVDHEITSKLVQTACFAAPVPSFWTYDDDPVSPIDTVPHLYYADPIEQKDVFGDQIEADFIVDVTDVMPTKEKMLACHASRREWLSYYHDIDEYAEAMKRFGQMRGREIGRPYGEGFRFRQNLVPGDPRDNIIAELLKLS